MNGTLKDFLLGLGALTEMWMITYNNFRNQGLGHAEAIEHTTAFTKVMLKYCGDLNISKQEDKTDD